MEPQEILLRIESCILGFLEQLLLHNNAPDLSLGTVTTRNGACERTRSLMARQGQGAHGYARLFPILETAYELLSLGMTASQRDVYYRLKTLDIFKTPEQVNQAIQDVASMLQVPSAVLGFSCASRGAVYGPLLVKEEADGEWMDCRMCARAIPGNTRAIAKFGFQSPAKFIVVIEKDAIFQRLVEDGIAEHIGGILVTAKGMPDMATRAFLHALNLAIPNLIPVAVVDWNPSGVNIFSVYKFGSTRRCLSQYALPGLQWLAARAALLHGVPNHVLQGPLTPRDKALITSLKAGPLSSEPDVLAELDAMVEMDAKAEIEALYERVGIDNFTAALAQTLLDICDSM